MTLRARDDLNHVAGEEAHSLSLRFPHWHILASALCPESRFPLTVSYMEDTLSQMMIEAKV